eukprot:16451521-Heterocapsa_arctica.AAC.2
MSMALLLPSTVATPHRIASSKRGEIMHVPLHHLVELLRDARQGCCLRTRPRSRPHPARGAGFDNSVDQLQGLARRACMSE